MAVSEAQFEAITSKASRGVAEIPRAAEALLHALEETYCRGGLFEPVSPFPPLLCPLAKRAVAEIQKLLDEYLPKVDLILNSLLTFPVWMWASGGHWTDIQQLADEVSNSAGWLSQSSEMGWWEGDAGAAYTKGVGDQSSAASGIAETAGTVSSACAEVFIAAFACGAALAMGVTAVLGGLVSAIPTVGAGAIVAILGAIESLGAALAELYFGIEQPERQLKGTLPIPYMVGGSSPAAGGWPSATQGS